MSEGLFKKRIETERKSWEGLGESEFAVNEISEKVQAIVVEAAKEIFDVLSKFPMASYGTNLLEAKECRKLLTERHDWFCMELRLVFLKWFGAEKEKTQ